jgi:hypothetical protein
MNRTTNDFGKEVIAVGAPGSIERMRVEKPKLIGELILMITGAGILSHLEVRSLLKAVEKEMTGSIE